ncbi:unnamed protein product [Pedinophyceae sp. YPF-701]|nr:unnamed protein product [Pedinophyceae sp. YPF-701]
MARSWARCVVVLVLAWVCGLLGAGEAIKLHLEAGEETCLSERFTVKEGLWSQTAEVSTKISLEQPERPGLPNADRRRSVTVKILQPDGKILLHVPNIWKDEKLTIPGHGQGSYRLCVYNTSPTRKPIKVNVVYFSVHHMYDYERYRKKTEEPVSAKGGSDKQGALVTVDHIAATFDVLKDLEDLVNEVRRDQQFLENRIERQMMTSRSTHRRAVLLALVEGSALVSVSVLQIVMLRRMFAGSHGGAAGFGVRGHFA